MAKTDHDAFDSLCLESGPSPQCFEMCACTMGRPVAASEGSCSLEGAFDMWKDYLGLPRILSSLKLDQGGRHAEEEGQKSWWITDSRSGIPSPPSATLQPDYSMLGANPEFPWLRSGDSPGLQAGFCCSFCKKNGASLRVYGSHTLRDPRGFVTCPVLRAYRCPLCGQTGDWAHTVKYCPRSDGHSTYSLLTARTSCGMWRWRVSRKMSGKGKQGAPREAAPEARLDDKADDCS